MKRNVFYILFFLQVSLISCPVFAKTDPELAQKIRNDERLKIVSQKAEQLLTTGLNAGNSYNEIWIRDLNTFIELACKVGDVNKIRESLITFFKLQGKDGNIVDGYVPKEKAQIWYKYIFNELAPQYAAHKNTVETDQESSLIQSLAKYIRATGDKSILDEVVGGKTVLTRMEEAMNFVMTERYNEKYGLIWGATTADWGDVQPEHSWGVEMDSTSHLAIDVYDNAMFIVAINDYLSMTDQNKKEWQKTKTQIAKNVRKYLWDQERQKFIPHLYLNGSPFPADFDENAIYYHGGTTAAIDAGLLSPKEIRAAYQKMQQNVKDAKAQSIGLTLYPVYPDGYFKNTWMVGYYYQNGGDWTWHGGRTVQHLITNGFYEEAYEALSPMLNRVIKNDGFFEWYTPEGKPNSGNFKGSAGVLWTAIKMLNEKFAI